MIAPLIIVLLACLGFEAFGVYLCMHDFPVLGGWICILALLSMSGISIKSKKTKT